MKCFCFLESFTILYHFRDILIFVVVFTYFLKTKQTWDARSFWRRKFIFPPATPFQKSKMKYRTKLLLRIFFDWNLLFPRFGNSLWVLYFSSNMQKFVPRSSIFCLFFQLKKHSILFHCYCLIVLFMSRYNFCTLQADVPSILVDQM